MRLSTAAQAQGIDRLSQSDYELSAEVLMEAAGALAAREIVQSFLPEFTRGTVAIVAGPGNNGGDALVVARHLHSSGHRNLKVYLVTDKGSELFELQRERAERAGLKLIVGLAALGRPQLIVDGIFGIGLNRPLTEPYSSAIEKINSCAAAKVSLDVPSGLNADTGRVEGLAIKATMTITFGLSKPGFFVSEGPAHVGKLRVLPIGFSPEALRKVANTHFLFTEKLARRYLPFREDSANKSMHGHLLVLAGRPGYWGAGILSSGSAFRMGVGYVTWASFTSPDEALKELPEILTARVDDDQIWRRKISAVAIGPGLGTGQETANLIERLKTLPVPVVVDADAITACVESKLFPLPAHWVITPHSGELARVLGGTAQEIDRDRFRAAFRATEKTGCHVLLKGFRSVLAFQQRCLVIHAGNAALAKAGTGDVLTGMIGGLLAQGVGTLQATATAAYVHGRVSEEWLRSGNDKSALSASDLRLLLPQVIARLRSQVRFS